MSKQTQSETINLLLADYAQLSAIFAEVIGERAITAQEQKMMDIMLRMHGRLTQAAWSQIS